MNDLAIPAFLDRTGLPGMVSRAAAALASAKSAAEVLEARDMASVAYDTAKRAARLARAKGAHDELVAKVHRAQADALEIEAAAKRKLADEYDAAQERGEVATLGTNQSDLGVTEENTRPATSAEIGISRKDIHEARLIRDAEEASPGIVHNTVAEAVDAGEEPTRAKVRRAVLRVVKPDVEAAPRPMRGKAAVIARVREALILLDGLPPAAEVVGYFRGSDASVVVDEHLISAATWLGEFGEIWREQNVEGTDDTQD